MSPADGSLSLLCFIKYRWDMHFHGRSNPVSSSSYFLWTKSALWCKRHFSISVNSYNAQTVESFCHKWKYTHYNAISLHAKYPASAQCNGHYRDLKWNRKKNRNTRIDCIFLRSYHLFWSESALTRMCTFFAPSSFARSFESRTFSPVVELFINNSNTFIGKLAIFILRIDKGLCTETIWKVQKGLTCV